MRTLALLVVLLAACASPSTTAFDCQSGATRACACTSGAQGAQTCSAARVYGACVCTSADAGVDVAVLGDGSADALADASAPDAADGAAVADATDVPGADAVEGGACIPACASGRRCVDGVCVVDGDAATDAAADAPPEDVPPPLYRSCEPVGSSCGAGVMCVTVPGLLHTSTHGVCARPCSTSADCPGHATRSAICVAGACVIDCFDAFGHAAQWCDPFGTVCAVSSTDAPDARHADGASVRYYCGQ